MPGRTPFLILSLALVFALATPPAPIFSGAHPDSIDKVPAVRTGGVTTAGCPLVAIPSSFAQGATIAEVSHAGARPDVVPVRARVIPGAVGARAPPHRV